MGEGSTIVSCCRESLSLSDRSVLFYPNISTIPVFGDRFSTLPIKDIAYGISKYFKGAVDLLKEIKMEAVNFPYCKSSVSQHMV